MYILDTNALLWYLDDSPKLSSDIKNDINNASSVYVSIASFWEIVIKTSIGKLEVPDSIEKIMDICIGKQIEILSIKRNHLTVLGDLPFIHRDPFDRLIVAQAKAENLTLITSDSEMSKYEVDVKWK